MKLNKDIHAIRVTKARVNSVDKFFAIQPIDNIDMIIAWDVEIKKLISHNDTACISIALESIEKNAPAGTVPNYHQTVCIFRAHGNPADSVALNHLYNWCVNHALDINSFENFIKKLVSQTNNIQ